MVNLLKRGFKYEVQCRHEDKRAKAYGACWAGYRRPVAMVKWICERYGTSYLLDSQIS